jgi:hypothetical protein
MDFVFEIKKEFFILEPLDDSAAKNPRESLSLNGPEMAKTLQIPSGVWVLGFVSMLMDISSEMIHSLLPMFMVTALGTSVFVVGLVEGLAEPTGVASRHAACQSLALQVLVA